MATLVLKAAGTALGGPVGGWIGAALGAYVDSRMISRIFGADVPAPRIGDIKAQTAEEGAPITMVMGPEIRTAGEVIWHGPVEAVEMDQGGGCGGPSAPLSYGYFADCAIAIGQPPPGLVVEAVDKMWADGKVLWERDPDISIASLVLQVFTDDVTQATIQIGTLISGNPTTIYPSYAVSTGTSVIVSGVTAPSAANGTWIATAPGGGGDTTEFTIPVNTSGTWSGDGQYSAVDRRMRIQSPNGGPDLSVFRAGYDVVVGGWPDAVNNGTFECISSNMDPATGISYVLLDNPNCVQDLTLGDSVTLYQDLPQSSARHFTSVTFHNGSQWQAADSLIEAVEGTGKVPGFAGICYQVFERFNKTAFGDRLPNVNTLTRVSTSWTVGQAIAAHLDRAGFDSAEYDVSAPTAPCRGYSIRGPVTTDSSFAALLLAFDVIAYQEDARAIFVRRKDLVATAIASTELVAHQPGSDAPRKSLVRPVRERVIPKEVQIHFQNPAKDYQGGMETARKTDGRGDYVESLETGITMSAGPAQDIARRVLWTGQANRDQLEIRLPPSRLLVREGSLLRFTDHGREWNMLVEKVDYGHDGTIICEGPNDEAAALDFTGSPADGGADDSGGPGILEALDMFVIDLAPLANAQVAATGVYVAVAPRGYDRVWIGGEAFDSDEDTDGTFTSLAAISRAATLGRTSGTLAGGVSAYMIDRKNTIDVVLSFGLSLASTTEAHMLGGKNRAVIGNEIVGFQTVTLIGTNTVRLSVLMRGLRDTEGAIEGHQANERFVHLDGSGLQFVSQDFAALDTQRYFRAVPTSGLVDDYPSVNQFYQANTVRPFTVRDVRGSRDGTDATPDVVVTWTRQTRTNVSIFSTTPIPLNEVQELYEVDLMDAATGLVVEATHSVSSPTTTFATAEIVAAGYAALDLIDVRVYQISDFTGRGRVRAATA